MIFYRIIFFLAINKLRLLAYPRTPPGNQKLKLWLSLLIPKLFSYPLGQTNGNAHAEFCVAGIPLNSDFAEVEANLKSLENSTTVEGCTVKVQYHTLFPAMEKGEQNSKAFNLLKKPAELLDMDIEELYVPGATDGAYFSSLGIPTVDALSAEFKDIHTVNECVNMPSIKERTKFFAVVLGCLE